MNQQHMGDTQNMQNHEIQNEDVNGIPIYGSPDRSDYEYARLYQFMVRILTTPHLHTISDDGIVIVLEDDSGAVFEMKPPLSDDNIVGENDIINGVGTQDIMKQLDLSYKDIRALRITVAHVQHIGRKIAICYDWWLELEHYAEQVIEETGDTPIRVGEGFVGVSTDDIAARGGTANTKEDFDRLYKDRGLSYRYLYQAYTRIGEYDDLLAQAFTYALTDYAEGRNVNLRAASIRGVMNCSRFMLGSFKPGVFFDNRDVELLTEQDIRENLPEFKQYDINDYRANVLKNKPDMLDDDIVLALTEKEVQDRMRDIDNLSNVTYVLEIVLQNMWNDFLNGKLDGIRYDFDKTSRGNVGSTVYNKSQYVVERYRPLWMIGYLI